MEERVNQEELMIRKEEMRAAMMRTKSGKAAGPDDIPVEEMSRREGSGPCVKQSDQSLRDDL